MALIWFFVKKTDFEKAKEYDAQYVKDVQALDPTIRHHADDIKGFCLREVENTDDIMRWLLIAHILGFVVCFYREIYSSSFKNIGFLMRFMEVFVLAVYMNVIFYTVFEISTWWLIGVENFPEVIRVLTDASNMLGSRVNHFDIDASQVLLPPCLTDREHRMIVFGRTLEWQWIELLVYIMFVFTMMILMIKSRCVNIGIDNSTQFNPVYLSHMVNRIIKNIEFNFEDSKSNFKKNKQFFTSKETLSFIEIEGICLYLNLTSEDYDEAREGILLDEETIVPPEKAGEWLGRNVPGNICREKLDYERFLEIQSQDMMQNSSIIYHCESVLECQILCLIVSFLFEPKLWISHDWEGHGDMDEEMREIVINFQCIYFFLLCEHIFSYSCHIFRKHDIKKNGKADVNGIF